jgi:hypothetical protein
LRHRRLCTLVALTALATTATATADDGPVRAPREAADVLRLRDGSTLHGQIIERQIDGTTVIVLVTGEVRTIPGAELDTATVAALEPATEPAEVTGPVFVLRPQPGRVPLVLQSNGPPLSVGGETTVRLPEMLGDGIGGAPLCTTPCTLYVRPGPVVLWSGGQDREPSTTHLEVPASGLSVRMRSVSNMAFVRAVSWVLNGSLLIIAGGAIAGFPIITPFLSNEESLALGLGIIGGGAALITLGAFQIHGSRTGAESQTPLGDSARRETPRRWTAGVVPLPGGALFGGGIVF